MITGAHAIVYSTNPDADRAVLRDVFKLPHVDVGGGWLIFALPPAEVAVHPSDKNDVHELYMMCEDVEAFVAEMKRHDLTCGPIRDQGWGLLTQLVLPGGGKLGVYQPRHARPPMVTAGGQSAPEREPARQRTKKPATKTARTNSVAKPAARRSGVRTRRTTANRAKRRRR